jgi:ABC-type sugar transport system substrate-binding protein
VKVLFAVLGEAAEEMMRAGCADYVVAQQPVMIGRTAVQMMDAIVKSKPLPAKKVEVPLVPVTMANLNSIDKTGMQAPKGWTP